jgi:UDP-N-acetylmuramoylalanine-D-glutamate ligase
MAPIEGINEIHFEMKKGEKVVIVGGGFAGLNFAKQMAKKEVEVILVDKQNHHQFQPLFRLGQLGKELLFQTLQFPLLCLL